MTEMNLIENRRHDVEQQIARLRVSLGKLEAELVELETAANVIARLTGAKRPETGTSTQPSTASAPSRTVTVMRDNPLVKAPPMSKLITDELEKAHADNEVGLEPKEMLRRIAVRIMPAPKGEYVSSIAWRMWKHGQLVKEDENSAVYSLPGRKPADLLSPAGEQSAGLSDQPAQDGEPVREVEHDNMNF
ncbi:hypothetical protein EN873_03890 [bacterium M00.F.Ca.ET.230.01.1.1]|nr:hypothetical protein EN873_03890 [bacterium M00.F.Ca.ET.230.01.1.1]